MNPAAADTSSAGPAGTDQPGNLAWTRSRWLTVGMLIFAAHVGLLFAFGARQPIIPRPATRAPALQLMGEAGVLLALDDPTLFAVPHPADLASAFRLRPAVAEPPSSRWTEPSGSLELSSEVLGSVFNEFMQTNRFAAYALQLKPPLEFSAPVSPIEPVLAPASTLRVEGELAQRPLLNPAPIPSLPYNDVIAPSRVQLLVDAAGNVVSAVLLPADDPAVAASRYDVADQRALELARGARFAPGPRPTQGRLVIDWHTVPPPATNRPAVSDESNH
ncbi:MAG TPA: hypothetical protein VMB80_03560 [Candidatus Acidoferrum sp.]|nr:hypothetical protein [Candidatus Acidoferrum sp.]